MKDAIELLLTHPVQYLADAAPDEDIAISSRIRLARNLNGVPFPISASDEALHEVCRQVSAAAHRSGALGCPACYEFEPSLLPEVDQEILFERRLASRDLLARREGTLLLVRADESCSVMVNEEDHLRIQSLLPGFQLDAVWERISKLDDELSGALDYAFDERLGYLTSCPTNVGTGMRASVMLHLPGLVLTGQMGPTVAGIGKLGLAVRGVTGEGSDNRGNLFQISNQSTLGESEVQIIRRLSQTIAQLIAFEKLARRNLYEKEKIRLFDHIGRSFGLLRYAYKLTDKEALDALSALRLGVDLGMFSKVSIQLVNRLFYTQGAAHLQRSAGGELSPEAVEISRAALFRKALSQQLPPASV